MLHNYLQALQNFSIKQISKEGPRLNIDFSFLTNKIKLKMRQTESTFSKKCGIVSITDLI